MISVLQVRTRKLLGTGWASFALIEDPTRAHRFNVYSLTTKDYPTINQLAQITVLGSRLPVHVAGLHFPCVISMRLGAITQELVAA